MEEHVTIRARPPDRPGDPGRGRDLASGLSQGEKHRVSDQDLRSSRSPSTECPASEPVGTAPNSSSLGVIASGRGALSPRVGCPAQPVGFACEPYRYRMVSGPTCPLGHPIVRVRSLAFGVRPAAS